MMDLIQKCTCLKPGLSFEKVPCPPPLFYDQFGEYALTKNLSRTEVCEIAETCMNRFQTTNSSQIIKNICNPQMTTIPVTTTTTVPPTTPTTTSPQTKNTNITQTATSPFSITSTTHQKVTSFHVPIVIASSCNGICVFGIVFGILLLIAAVIAVVLIRKFKCPCVKNSSRMRSCCRKKSEGLSFVYRQSRPIKENVSTVSLTLKDICGLDMINQGFLNNENEETAHVESVKRSRSSDDIPEKEKRSSFTVLFSRNIDMTEEREPEMKDMRTKCVEEEEANATKANVTRVKSLDETKVLSAHNAKHETTVNLDKLLDVADTRSEQVKLNNSENVSIKMASSDDDSNEDDDNDISDGNGNADNCDDDDDDNYEDDSGGDDDAPPHECITRTEKM